MCETQDVVEEEIEGTYSKSREEKLEDLVEATLYREHNNKKEALTFLKHRYEGNLKEK